MEWSVKNFQDLTLNELYQWIQLRLEVFVIEQNCPYQDLDDKDRHGYHLLGKENGKILAGSRLLPPGISYEHYASIGRVVTHPSIRHTGAGKMVMIQSLVHCAKLFQGNALKISAQSYLIRFYESFGFIKIGEEYLEDNIPHCAMIRPAELPVPS